MKANAARTGLQRGWIEFRQTLTTPQDLWGYLFPTVILLVVMSFQRGSTVAGFSLGAMTLPGALGMGIGFSGLITIAQQLTVEREDGTLLRAKATPDGMFGYLIGKITLIGCMSLVSLVILLVPGLVMFDGLATGVDTWLTLVWVLVLGLVATMPIGAIIGSLFANPRSLGLIMLPMMGLIAISGIFYPITGYPEWLQWIAQVFPMYWLGLGMRSALLPDGMAAAEIGESWRHLETAGVLGLWAVVGLVVAPVVLRRMARRESGSSVAARREKAMQRVR
ncbi:ABC transporter permease [Saccharopolyspora spinosa]|uniref:ABC-2 type transport system permease protein n=1 Tax=Saccharopolyspora spinosa TaxID=60894 RepID=A0A2N3XUC5_SACSN|nr:ABC transporter permease [Saccharopolyspora spinosa]PKW14255.1 ABC-2 type transport system permease protein [Saccharopolyspora spinosa]